MRNTHTYAVLEISAEAHAEIKGKLLATGYGHAIDGEIIDMHGIALQPRPVSGAALSAAILEQPTVAEALNLNLSEPVALKALNERYPDGVTIDRHGNLSGDPVAIETFKEYCRVRGVITEWPKIDEAAFKRP